MSSTEQLLEKADAANLEKLKQLALARHKDKIQGIKDFAALQPDHPYTAANKQVLELDSVDTWAATGLLSMTGLGWWALNLTADLAPPHYVIYNATGGPDWSIALFTSTVFGYFLVDPSTLGGEYDFNLQAVAGGLGEISFDLYRTNGAQIATFSGAVAGISISKVVGSGTLKYY